MKKRLAVFLSLFIAAVLTGGVVWGCYSDIPQIHYPTSMLNVALYKADLVIGGTIISATPAMQQNYQKQIGNGKCTSYTVQIDDIWFGECDTEEIDLLIDNDYRYMRFHEKDKAVFLLRESSAGENVYELSQYENSIFIKNPPFNLLFPLSPAEACIVYDGETAGKLKADMKKALRRLARKGIDIDYASGVISAPYKEKYLARHPEEGQK